MAYLSDHGLRVLQLGLGEQRPHRVEVPGARVLQRRHREGRQVGLVREYHRLLRERRSGRDHQLREVSSANTCGCSNTARQEVDTVRQHQETNQDSTLSLLRTLSVSQTPAVRHTDFGSTLAHPLRRALRRQSTRVAFFPASSRPPDSAPSLLCGGGLTCPPPFRSRGRAARRRRPSGSPATASSGCRSAAAGSLASSGRRRSPRPAARCTGRRRRPPPAPG